ncbi:hypothetical protein NC796_09085 [Aliifodinibius sp. S!AR15-10]|uniref:thiol-activated cytolysin C-terminal domain-containing protein n=1 Tax=Aliifodinibius sp. S!AR15-10 TaxID=2950437 RepID=UPI0028561103|nr:thiol-activated cytolysin C-terminal domain-containing protein [Aliifodinibius sp. S!AR15-10]MDR8391289.1 hypothetical protein [Aliifodinibius sp. S!AR15-10]
MNDQEVAVEPQQELTELLDAEPGGSILIRCEGGYVARFTVSYKYKGKEISKHSGDISIGVNKSISIPEGVSDIHLKVEEMWGFGWSTIFTKNFDSPVTKCYKVYGTTLNPKYSKIDC